MRTLTLLTMFLVLLGSGAISAADAQEAACNALGGNCQCSSPMQTTSVTNNGGAHTPNDSSKNCGAGGAPIGFPGIFGPGQPLYATTAAQDPTIFNALPSGHTNTYVYREPDGFAIALVAGHFFDGVGGVPTARRALRMYTYTSPNTAYTVEVGPNQCNNVGKLIQLSDDAGPLLTVNNGGGWTLYGWLGVPDGVPTGWNLRSIYPFFDCCLPAVGIDNAAQKPASFQKGKWWRDEIVITNVNGTPMRIQVFRQDVTTSPRPAELKIMDTALTCTGCGNPDWSATVASQVSRPLYNGSVIWDLYRCFNGGCDNFSSTGPCPGFYAITYMMGAAWSTNAGQRIGPAIEIEGGAPPPPPAHPTNLRQTSSIGAHLSAGMTLVVAVALSARRRRPKRG